MNTHTSQIVVIGGGYSGTLAANHLLSDPNVAVTLVNPRAEFVERIRLHQLVAETGPATQRYDELLNPRVRLVVDTATAIDPAARQVRLASGESLPYDYLIYAVGSTAATLSIPGVTEFAYPIAELEEAELLRHAVADLPDGAPPICVVGAGPTGIEVAAELGEQGRPVTLVCGGVLGPYLSTGGRRKVAKRLKKLGVQVIDGPGSVVVAVGAHAVTLADGRDVAAAVTIWTAGFGVPQLAARSGLRTDAIGRLLTDETLTSVDDERIVAAGDASAPSDLPLRMSCQAAGPLGATAARTVLSRIAGTEPAALSVAFTGQCISLGRGAGALQFAHTDDRARNLVISGRMAAAIKETVCKGTVSVLRREARKPGSYFWIRGGKRRQRLAEHAAAR